MIILASASPRRQELLREAGIEFLVDPSQSKEIVDLNQEPEDIVMSLASDKASDVAKRHPNDLVIAADTIVWYQNEVLGKPRNRDDAKRMLKLLSNKKHYVYTGVCYYNNGTYEREYSKSEVVFNEINDNDLESYLDSNEPYDKAGAYAIQGEAKKFVKTFNGDYFTIVGLPIKMVLSYLKKEGIK